MKDGKIRTKVCHNKKEQEKKKKEPEEERRGGNSLYMASTHQHTVGRRLCGCSSGVGVTRQGGDEARRNGERSSCMFMFFPGSALRCIDSSR